MATLVAEKPWLRNRDNGIIGAAARASQAMNATSSAAPPMRLARTWALVQRSGSTAMPTGTLIQK
ncbi:MAG TPA: hypothetical protein VN767_02700, partial [Streptosporangiaceae bacterium]|nr:hypothetical protein [Streptosporangiaceae bacterium]